MLLRAIERERVVLQKQSAVKHILWAYVNFLLRAVCEFRCVCEWARRAEVYCPAIKLNGIYNRATISKPFLLLGLTRRSRTLTASSIELPWPQIYCSLNSFCLCQPNPRIVNCLTKNIHMLKWCDTPAVVFYGYFKALLSYSFRFVLTLFTTVAVSTSLSLAI